MSPLRRWLPLAGWVLGLLALAWAMGAAGRGDLAGPDLGRPATWGDWAAARPPAAAALAVVRLVALGLSWYLVAATAVAVAAQVTRAGRIVAVADLLTLPPIRRAVHVAI